MTISISKNIGTMDRIIRSIVGMYMIINGLKHKNSSFHQMETVAGGALLISSLTGHCAMLSTFGASTIPGKENNIIDQVKKVLPEQVLKPLSVKPKKEEQSSNADEPVNENPSVG